MKKSKGKSSPFPWWEKRRQAMERKHSFSESQYIPVGKNKVNSSPVRWKEPVRNGEDAVKLSAQQEYVLDLIRQGKNVFYTGNAGTGKTTLLREIQKCSPEGTFVTALTGVAAVQAGGTTLHSFAGIGLGNGTKENLYSIVLRGQKAKNWRSANVLIIDEVSMLDGKLFDKLEYIARKIRQCEKPFGGIQLVLCGDFFQLPPIQKVGETSVNYCFQSSSWVKVLDYSLELTQIYRQSDPKLIKLLNEVRYRHVSAESLELLKYLNRPLNCGDIEPTKLYSHNKSVNDINNRKLDSLEGEEKTYYASDHGQSPYKENLSKYVIAMEKLVLKKGAQVMLLKNLTEELINGSRGVVEEFDEEGWPRVKFTDGTLKTINVVDWNLENSSGIVLARRTQVPLKLAWAITIHKSQGMSIDLLQVDLKHVFSQGQAYVALSRARTIEGLQVLTFDETKFTTSDAVIRFYREKIQKAPGHVTAEPSTETSPLSSIQQKTSPKDMMTTPSKKRRSEDDVGNSAKKRFRSSSSTSPVDSHDPKAKHEQSYSSQESSLSSSQGENSQMVSSSSSSHTPYVKRGFQKASELYSDSSSQNKEFSLSFLIEEATDEECLLASPTLTPTPTQLVVKRKRPKQSNLFDNFIQPPKDDEITPFSNTDLKASGGQDGSSWKPDCGGRQESSPWNTDSGGQKNGPYCNKDSGGRKHSSSWTTSYGGQEDGPYCNSNSGSRQNGSYWNADSADREDGPSPAGKQKCPSTRGTQANQTATKANAKSNRQRSRATKAAHTQTHSAENNESNSRLEAKVKRQREKSKRKSSIMFDALKKHESNNAENLESGPSIKKRITSSERCKTSTQTNNRQTDEDLRSLNIQMGCDESFSDKITNDVISVSQKTCLHFDDKLNASVITIDDDSEPNSANELSPSGIEVACERSRERSKVHCSKLFEALKKQEDGELPESGGRVCEEQQLGASVVPYYADKNLVDLDSGVHRSASIKLHELRKNILGETPLDESEGIEGVVTTYPGYSTNTSQKTKTGKNFELKTSSKDAFQGTEATTSKDAITQTEMTRRGRSDSLGAVREEEATTQTDTFPGHPCSNCLGVQQDGASSDKEATSTRQNNANSLELCTFSQTNTRPCNHSIRNLSDLQGMYIEFRIPSLSFVIAELNKMMRTMLFLAALMCGLYIQVFCKQLED